LKKSISHASGKVSPSLSGSGVGVGVGSGPGEEEEAEFREVLLSEVDERGALELEEEVVLGVTI